MKPLAGAGSVAAIEAWLIARVEGSTGIAREEIDISRPFAYFGLSSSNAVSLSGELEDLLGRPLPATLVWDYPTIECLARHLAGCADAVKTGSGRDPGQPPTDDDVEQLLIQVEQLTEEEAACALGRLNGSARGE